MKETQRKALDFDKMGPNDLRPNAGCADPARGPLAHVPAGIETVFDYGAPAAPWGSLYPDYKQPTRTPTSSASIGDEEAKSPVKNTPAR